MKEKVKSFLLHLLLPGVILVMTACGPANPDHRPVQTSPTETQPSQNIHTTPQPTPTEKITLSNILTICTSRLPTDLLPYSVNSTANKSNLLSLVYEQPFLSVDGELTPLILEKVPSQIDGDLALTQVSVQAGQSVVDSHGRVRILKPGLQVRPSGCRDSDCAITWDGESPLEMDQMTVDYQIREDLNWPDGMPVIAGDSVFSYEVALDFTTSGLTWAIDRTAGYRAINQSSVQWRGIPGFTTAEISRFFWKPLPAHLYQESFEQGSLGSDSGLSTIPIGCRPYEVTSRADGLLVFSRNPNYFRNVEGYPNFDQIQVRQVDSGLQQGWLDLQNGDCDVIDSTFNLFNSPDLIIEIQSDPNLDLQVETGESWTQLVFGIKPASHDDFYNPELGDRPDYFGDARVRQGIMHCLDRVSMLESLLGGRGEVWQSYLPVDGSSLGMDQWLTYDPAKGIELLQAAGWYDLDGNPSTPLQSWFAPNVPGGAPLSLELLVSTNPFHQTIAEAIKTDLAECGVDVGVTTLPMEGLYASGPEGPLFGRKFDLAIISWQPMPGGDCQIYQSWAIPSKDNYWIGTNVAGLLNESYDNACAEALLALPDEKVEAEKEAELGYLDNLPAVPFFSIPKTMVIPSSGCSDFEFSSEEEFFAGIATFGINEMCP